ncbi:hypothetical protein P175DRAFT_0431072 [Aspergillus ochraceoroseus IBT 24754]|uniref:superoxide dismutase n=3 Tax=Aspergillus subgen. Nidulantes TaxID=2720870 RepID=A0A0F8WRF6_9EURO|nr:uncharacterized protein P175DRAFT_0431072 [Aspergillus ochraceoroseus IBT 24754]KKK20225.1 hypothetical protein ARAM_004877 [Aspergillus rambellii]KKK24608.1 hypothetical protein AOCH_003207 [Aspergillus ochraceoroseus]PTU22652.1 hypothetical protein P175DRAFT_0431072 [Aspergillus ochraceoroseus IBT 24754]
MHSKLLTGAFLGLALSAFVQGTDTDAPVVTDNQRDSFFQASLSPKDNTTVFGGVTIIPASDSTGLRVVTFFGGIPEGEYLTYHIHEHPVPEDGNCYSTGGHLDPYGRGDATPCVITAPQTCQVGDLSGKHGPAFAPPNEVFQESYIDYFISNTPGQPAYFGDLSLVVHSPNGSRLACGNFEELAGGK